MIVTIDGPAGTGKSTAARGLAERLGFRFLDTGAMYRAVAYECGRRDIDPHDDEAVAEVVRDIEIALRDDGVFVNGADATEAIRSADVTQAASVVATNSAVRNRLNELQRRIASADDYVTEGRDQGTIVFPDAVCKFFLTAAAAVRAERRRDELQAAGVDVSFEELLAQIRDRDRRDETREVGPLRAADDAIRIDTSELTAEAVLDQLEQTARERIASERE